VPYGQVEKGSKEWKLQRVPKEKVQVLRETLECLQAELANLKEIEIAARNVAAGFNHEIAPEVNFECSVNADLMGILRQKLNRYDGWVDDPDVRDQIVDSLMDIVEELDDDRP
jgi:hypothetical protein